MISELFQIIFVANNYGEMKIHSIITRQLN